MNQGKFSAERRLNHRRTGILRDLAVLVLFFAGYALAAALNFSGGIGGGLAFALSVLLIVLYDRRMQKKDNTIYTITGYAEKSHTHE